MHSIVFYWGKEGGREREGRKNTKYGEEWRGGDESFKDVVFIQGRKPIEAGSIFFKSLYRDEEGAEEDFREHE